MPHLTPPRHQAPPRGVCVQTNAFSFNGQGQLLAPELRRFGIQTVHGVAQCLPITFGQHAKRSQHTRQPQKRTTKLRTRRMPARHLNHRPSSLLSASQQGSARRHRRQRATAPTTRRSSTAATTRTFSTKARTPGAWLTT